MEQIIITILTRALVAGTPLLLATIGEIITERSGIINLGVEGMMAIGAVTGFVAASMTGNPWIGMICAIFAGCCASLIHGFVSIFFQANQVVSGLALTLFGLGVSGLWGKPFIGKPLAARIQSLSLPVLSDIPYVGEILFRHDPYFYLALFFGVAAWFLLYKTKPGIIIRSVGENPGAAHSQGINVTRVRYSCVLIGGGFAGMAGSHLSLAYSNSWIEGMTAGRGWIVIALTIFSLWNPARAFFGAFLFGGIFVLQYILQPLGISPNLLAAFPYLMTLGILVLYGITRKLQRKMHAPGMLGEPFRK
ncbi:MAG: ABC transporter permease [Spirochaetales bacterium]|nr:ABC transporter permease [Spirochaetales bacterium]